MLWEKAEPKRKRFKILLIGRHGTYKTRTMLRLADTNGHPALAVWDTESGTDHYADFNFVRIQTPDFDEGYQAVKEIIDNPRNTRCLGIDSISVVHEAVTSKFADLFLKREIGSAGHKRDYYRLQPRDYQHIHREETRLLKRLIGCDLHVVATAQTKDLWDSNFRVVGKTFDGFKRLPFYFDIVLFIEADKDGKLVATVQKDRTNRLPETIPWSNDQVAYGHLVKALGTDLTSGDHAKPVQPDSEKPSVSVFATNDQLDTIKKLKSELGINANDWAKLLEPFEVKTARDLSPDLANEFVEKLKSMRPTRAQGD